LYWFGRRVRHIPLHLRNLLHTKEENGLTDAQFVTISYKEVFFDLLLDPANGLIDESIYTTGVWEPNVSSFIYDQLNDGNVFLDVGANIGYFSLLSAKRVGSSGQVIAFEPIGTLATQLERSVEKNSLTNIKLIRSACGEREASMKIGKYKHNIGKSSLIDAGMEQLETETVSVLTIDSVLENTHRLDLIKIDVEGFEPEVLMGARKTLSRLRPVIILEFGPKRMLSKVGGADSTTAMFELLKSLNYKIRSIKGEEVQDAKEFTARQISIGSFVELICIPENES